MSRDEQIFFDPGHCDPRRAAVEVARAIDGRFLDGSQTVGAAVYVDEIELGGFVSGAIWENDVGAMSDPEKPSDWEVHDRLPLIWNLMQGPRYDEQIARAGARLAFDRLVASGLGWPMVLAHDVSELIATYDVENGVREFPPGTSTFVAERR